jgi:hypothetical protein
MMKRTVVLLVLASTIGLVAVPKALAQVRGDGYRPGVWGDRVGMCPMSRRIASQPTKLELQTVSGEIVRIDRMMFGRGGIHIHLERDGVTTEVSLGPSWYFEDRNFSLQMGDLVEIRGFPISSFSENIPALVAIEVRKGDEVLTLRDEAGFPLWHGGEHHHHFKQGVNRWGGW